MDQDAFRLVLAFDSSPAAMQAARFVAAHRGARTQVLALIVPPRETLAEQGERELEEARSLLREASAEVEYGVRVGFPPEEILAEARDCAAHAIVAGTRARGGMLGLGSFASEVLRGSEFPVILVKQQARLPAALGRRARVVLATDGSTESLRATALIGAWTPWLGEVSVDVLHAQERVPLLEKLAPAHHDPTRRQGREEAEGIVRAAQTALAGCPEVRTHILTGDPSSCIARLAGEVDADLIVMGTRGRGARQHVIFGGVAMKTVQWSGVPVVLVP